MWELGNNIRHHLQYSLLIKFVMVWLPVRGIKVRLLLYIVAMYTLSRKQSPSFATCPTYLMFCYVPLGRDKLLQQAACVAALHFSCSRNVGDYALIYMEYLHLTLSANSRQSKVLYIHSVLITMFLFLLQLSPIYQKIYLLFFCIVI